MYVDGDELNGGCLPARRIMGSNYKWGQSLAAEITRASSKQTFYTIRLLVDRDRIEDAYRAYAYFRWVDDILDAPEGSRVEKELFIQRQRELLEASFQGSPSQDLCPEESMLVELVQSDTGDHPGLRSYLHHMMAVMEFDVERRGRVISQAELNDYSHHLAAAVMDALLYFIGHNEPPPAHHARYHAVTAAHITHMLRDSFEDTATGYYNVSGEYRQTHGISDQDWDPRVYREWVRNRVRLADRYFKSGREFIAQIKNFRCRLAGYAYAARFEWVLQAIVSDDYFLRQDYSQRKSIRAALKMFWSTLTSMLTAPFMLFRFERLAEQPVRIEEQ
jgi:phytoene/squalene synthetase